MYIFLVCVCLLSLLVCPFFVWREPPKELATDQFIINGNIHKGLLQQYFSFVKTGKNMYINTGYITLQLKTIWHLHNDFWNSKRLYP